MYINYVHPEERLYVDMYDNRGYFTQLLYSVRWMDCWHLYTHTFDLLLFSDELGHQLLTE